VAVLSMRQAHARLWQKDEHAEDLAGNPSEASSQTASASPPVTAETAAGTQSLATDSASDAGLSKVRPATCPKCGGDRILFLENAPLKRRVLGVYEDGRLSIHSFYVTLDELGESHRLACEGCDHEWPVDLNLCEFF
jgi:hypothetical protein